MSNSPDSGNIERHISPPPSADNPESLKDRFKRHIEEIRKGKKIDARAIVTGCNQIIDQLTLAREVEGRLTLDDYVQNYAQHPGLDFSTYAFQIPLWPSIKLVSPDHPAFHSVKIRIWDFPLDSHLETFVTPQGQKPIHTASFLDHVPSAIASITGPTFTEGDNLPNNGFYFKDTGDRRPFMDTNPSGKRRGAFGINDKGELKLMDDGEKWAVVNSGFAGYRMLAGTSYFILGSDDNHLDQTDIKISLSYLIHTRRPDGQLRLGFARCERLLSRLRLAEVMKTHAEFHNSNLEIAVEMEYGKSACAVKTPTGMTKFGRGFDVRLDHYVIVQGREKSNRL